jgi:hypothetical protein
VAVTVHLEHDRKPLSMLLDIVEVAKFHSGVNLATAFAEILETFGIKEKEDLYCLERNKIRNTHQWVRYLVLL